MAPNNPFSARAVRSALLETLNPVKGSWQDTLETGAAASAAITVPFLAMGMSISADGTN